MAARRLFISFFTDDCEPGFTPLGQPFSRVAVVQSSCLVPPFLDSLVRRPFARCCPLPHQTFARMKEAAAMKGVQKGSAYLSTHPADDERIAKQKEWMDSALQVAEARMEQCMTYCLNKGQKHKSNMQILKRDEEGINRYECHWESNGSHQTSVRLGLTYAIFTSILQ